MTSEELLVSIPQGTLRGRQDVSLLGIAYYSFLRIPYAKSPIGSLRFKSPEPAQSWTGVRDATESGARFPAPNFLGSYNHNADEDSLFVNIYTKSKPQDFWKEKLPVMVYIHGGKFTVGSGNKDSAGPDFFMAYNVILVTMNYRLGALGFLSLQTVECPGNHGLKDQQLALKWIKQNIKDFGGDPENITIFGESAGATSVQYHLLSPSSKGLFNRAITQSGSVFKHAEYSSQPRECAFLLGKRLGCDTKDDSVLLDFLRAVPAQEIIEKSQKLLHELKEADLVTNAMGFAFMPTTEPVAEGAFITKHPLILIEEGQCQDVPIITGACSKEMLIAVKNINNIPKWVHDTQFQTLIPPELKANIGPKLAVDIARKIKEFYFADGIDPDSYVNAVSAVNFVYGVYKTAKFLLNQKRKSPIYLYRFSYDGGQCMSNSKLKDVKGAAHLDDIRYLLTSALRPFPSLEIGSRDYKMMLRFTKLWVDFATTGIPTDVYSEVSWPPTDAEKMAYLDIGDKLQVKDGFFREEMEFWDEIYDSVDKANIE